VVQSLSMPGRAGADKRRCAALSSVTFGCAAGYARLRMDRRAPDSPVSEGGARWGLCLGVVGLACKGAVFAFGTSTLQGGTLCAWTVAAQDLRLAVVFAVLAEILLATARSWGRAAVRILYVVLAFYTIANVPVMRHLSSPLTPALLHATGVALGDSLAHYLTWVNVGVPLALAVLAACLPAVVSRAVRRFAAVAPFGRGPLILLLAGGALTWVVPGPSRCRALPLRRSPVETLVRGLVAARFSSPPELPSLRAPACRPREPLTLSLASRRRQAAFLAEAKGRNLVWIVLESTSARALAQVPSPMPSVAALARDALVFENAYCAYPESIKGLFASLCGRAPPPGREASTLGVAAVSCHPVATALAQAGYRTGLFHSGWFAYLGMDAVVRGRGFDVLVDARDIASPVRTSFGVDDDATARRLLSWLDSEGLGRAGRKPFFAVFMPIAGHHPYHAPSLRPRARPEASEREAYTQDLGIADGAVSLLREGLVSRGLDARTTYVVVGDHGEAFGDHDGNVAHALHVYEENVHVPLFIAAPGVRQGGLVSPQLASTLDLAPTLLDLAGISDDAYEGHSLFDGEPRVARFFTEQASRRRGLRDGRWKMVWHVDDGRAELFDLAHDPWEAHDLSADDPDRVASYRACLGP